VEETAVIFSRQVISDGKARFTSNLYGFSFETGSEYNHSTYSIVGTEVASYMLERVNSNTNIEPNRDTPREYNTAADDRISVKIFKNENQITVKDMDGFIS